MRHPSRPTRRRGVERGTTRALTPGMETTTTIHLWLPTIPYNIIAAVNRCAAATGSPGYALAASHADYNGHGVTVEFNTFRKYWVAYYIWSGPNWIARGSFEDCARAGKEYYERGALGADVRLTAQTEEQAAYARTLGYVDWSPEIAKAQWASFADDRFAEVGWALRSNTTHLLIKAKNVAEYRELCDDRDFGKIVRRYTFTRGDERGEMVVRARRVRFERDGQERWSGPRDSAPAYLRELVSQGWTRSA